MVGRKPKLRPEDVVLLRLLYKTGLTQRQISRRFGIADKTARSYLKGEHKNRSLSAVSPYPL